MQHTRALAAAFFVAAVVIRIVLLHGPYDHLRHGSAPAYGSAALGLYSGRGLTIDYAEIIPLQVAPSNLTGDYRTLLGQGPRAPFTEFLPGPALLLAGLWHILPVYNFAPYLYLQVLLDSLMIALFVVVLLHIHRPVILLTAVLMIINVPVIRRTVMMGYDFWPQFAVLATVVGAVYILHANKSLRWYVFLGSVTALTLWFRDITTLLPLAVSLAFYFVLRREKQIAFRQVAGRLAGYLLPFLVSIVLLSVVRYETTGNMRPTRSTFWHTFMSGVGQFSNPYGIECIDESVWEFAKSKDPQLAAFTLQEMYELPDSPYELMLKEQAAEFVTQHPDLVIRNILFRIAIMISPVFYDDGDFLSRQNAQRLYPVGFVLLVLWALGMAHIRRQHRVLFAVALAVYGTFFVSFSWFYIAGRAILPYLFLSIAVWLFGLIETYAMLQKMVRTARNRYFH